MDLTLKFLCPLRMIYCPTKIVMINIGNCLLVQFSFYFLRLIRLNMARHVSLNSCGEFKC